MSLHSRLLVTLGFLTAMLVTPVSGYGLLGPFERGQTPIVVAIALGTGLLGIAVAALGLRRLSDPATWFRDGFPLAGLIALSGVVLMAAFPVAVIDGLIAAAPFAVGGILGGIAAFLTGYVADKAVLARNKGNLSVTFRARKRPVSRLRRGIAAVAVGLAAIWATLEVLDGDYVVLVGPALLSLGQIPPLVRHRRSRRYTLTDAGIGLWSGHLPWGEIESYSLTDESLRIHASVWPFGTIELDRHSIDGLDGVVAALDKHLPRERPSRDEDPGPLDNVREALNT